MPSALPQSTSFRHRLQRQNNNLHIRTQQHTTTQPATCPASPRIGTNISAGGQGQSRFVEGSMNDRVSAAPPAGFLGLLDGFEETTTAAAVGEGPVVRGVHHAPAVSRGGGGGGRGGAEEEERYQLRRPRSTAAWVADNGGRREGGVVVKKTSFWDGVKEKLHLNKAKSSGSIGKVMNSVVGGERRGERERERVVVEVEEKVVPTAAPATAAPTTGYPSREEVMESYKNLVASGFFEAHAIRGGRHPLRPGAGVQEPNGRPSGEHMAAPGAMPSPGKSFADRMAAPSAAPPAGRSFADHMAAQQHPGPPLRHSMPPPPRRSSQSKPPSLSSPNRGTKRGASLDLAADAEMVTRKLVKKLRHSASRISMELSGARDTYTSYGTLNKSRPSTSWNTPGPLSPTSSAFSSGPVTSPPPTAPAADDTRSIRHGKLTKPKDGQRRRIIGLTRRQREPEADPDAMMLDEPEPPAPNNTTTTECAPRIHRIITPPPAAFRSHHHPQRMRTSSATSSLMSIDSHHHPHEPLSIVPDPNQGIPFVPRIPREFCDAMAAMAPAAVVVGGKVERSEVAGEEGKGVVNRDSGLGEDVENMPVWG